MTVTCWRPISGPARLADRQLGWAGPASHSQALRTSFRQWEMVPFSAKVSVDPGSLHILFTGGRDGF